MVPAYDGYPPQLAQVRPDRTSTTGWGFVAGPPRVRRPPPQRQHPDHQARAILHLGEGPRDGRHHAGAAPGQHMDTEPGKAAAQGRGQIFVGVGAGAHDADNGKAVHCSRKSMAG